MVVVGIAAEAEQREVVARWVRGVERAAHVGEFLDRPPVVIPAREEAEPPRLSARVDVILPLPAQKSCKKL